MTTRNPKRAPETRGTVRTNHVVRLSALLLAAAIVVSIGSGCAQVMAIRQPAPIDRQLLTVGQNRTVVIGVLGAPISAEDRGDAARVEVYKYVDGGAKNAWWSKTGRVLLYTAGDVFTACLDQVIWMPESASRTTTRWF